MAIISEIKDQQIVNLVNKKFEVSENYFRTLRSKWEDYDDIYFGVPETKKYDWQSNVFVPAVFKSIQTIACRCINTVFPNGELVFNVAPREESDVGHEEAVKNLLVYQTERAKLYEKYVTFVLQSLIRGTSIMKSFWNKELRTRKINVPDFTQVIDPNTGQPIDQFNGYKTVSQQFTVFDDPNVDVIDLFELYLDPKETNFDDSYKIHKLLRSFDYLKKKEIAAIYKNVNLIKASSLPTQQAGTHRRLSKLGLADQSTTTIGNQQEKATDVGIESADVELLEAEIPYDLNGDGLEEMIWATVANRKVLLRAIENPYWHGESNYIDIVFLPVLKEIYGMGVCEIAESLQSELNTKRNQRLDNVNVMLQAILVYVEGAVDAVVIQHFEFKPGAKLPVKDLNAIRWETPPNYTQGYVIEEKEILRDIEESTGAVREISPSSGSGEMHRTATGLSMLQGMANERLRLIILLQERMGVGEILQRFHQLNQQFLTQEKAVRILGKEGYTFPRVSPEDVSHNYDFTPSGSSSLATKEMQLIQLLKFLEVSLNVPPQSLRINLEEIYKRVWGVMGFQNADEIVLPPLPPPPPMPEQGGMPPPGMPPGGGQQPPNLAPEDLLGMIMGGGGPASGGQIG